MKIEVKEKVNAGGTWYDITIDGVTIYGCQRKQGTSANGDYDFISMPQRKYVDKKTGKDKWTNIVSLDKELADEVLDAIKEYGGEGKNKEGFRLVDEITDLEPF